MQPIGVEMSAETAAELRARGGNLYVWDAGGKTFCRTIPPNGPILFDAIPGDRWTLHVQREITPPSFWIIRWRRFPRKRFQALYDGDADWNFSLLGAIDAFFSGG